MVAKGKGSHLRSGTIRLMWRGRLSTNIRSMFSRRKEIPMTAATLRIRQARSSDTVALERLAALDSSVAPQGDVLLAEVGDELWAAFSLQDGHHIADPLRPSADAVLMLGQRARQLHRRERRGSHPRLRFA
jgi:hypothetical protein